MSENSQLKTSKNAPLKIFLLSVKRVANFSNLVQRNATSSGLNSRDFTTATLVMQQPLRNSGKRVNPFNFEVGKRVNHLNFKIRERLDDLPLATSIGK